MQKRELKIGDLDAIVEMVRLAGFRVTEPNQYGNVDLMVGDETKHLAVTKAIDDDIAELVKARPFANGRDRDKVRCRHQRRVTSMGYAYLSLSTNIYGFTVENRMRANICGGLSAVNPRGQTLEEAIRHAINRISMSEGKVTLRIPLKGLCSLGDRGHVDVDEFLRQLGA